MKLIFSIIILVIPINSINGIANQSYVRPSPDTCSIAIEQFIKGYNRPITILDFCPKEQFFLLFSRMNSGVYVMLDPDPNNNLLKTCKINDCDRVLLLKHTLVMADLEKLTQCEHFDVVLLDSMMLNQFADRWQQALDYLLQMGDHIFIQTSVPEHIHYLKQKKLLIMARTDTKTLFISYSKRNHLTKRNWNSILMRPIGQYTILSTFDFKQLRKNKPDSKKQVFVPWHYGINLLTFKMLHGNYPTKETICSMLLPLKTIKHNDLQIFNIIIQGKRLIPIDGNEKGRDKIPAREIERILFEFRKRKLDTD